MNFSIDVIEGVEFVLKILYIQDNYLIDQYVWEVIGVMKNFVNLDIFGIGFFDILFLFFYSYNNLGSFIMRNNNMIVLR